MTAPADITKTSPAANPEATPAKRKYKKRIIVPRRLPVDSDNELCAAQKFNERIDDLLSKLNNTTYPLSRMEPNLLQQFVELAELVQESIIDGIEAYEVRRSPSCYTEAPKNQINADSFLPGAYGMGRRNSR